jgi:polyisoprenoid-binding protein YceI
MNTNQNVKSPAFITITSKIFLLLIVISFLGLTRMLSAQVVYSIKDSKDAEIKVKGSSTLHDWTMQATGFAGEAQVTLQPSGGNQLQTLKTIYVTVPVKNLKSNESSMDDNAYETLKADKYANIIYKMTYDSIVVLPKNKYQIKAVGDLYIAGAVKAITMTVDGQMNDDGSITFTGSQKLKLTDFGIKRPSFMLGAMKVGDDLNIDFTLKLKK